MGKNWIVTKVNQNYLLRVGFKKFKCQIGSGGLKIHTKKREGDKATPIGKWKLKSIYYRSDNTFKPIIRTKTFKINKFINIKNLNSKNINYEKLWREDQAYDVVIETSYNSRPIIKGKGSAIFVHCSFSDFRKTAGCIALKKKDLSILIKNLSKKTNLEIKNNF